MRCPRCNAKTRDGAAVCAQCDEILDPSQFEHDGDEVEGERTDVGPAPTSSAQGAAAARARAIALAAAKKKAPKAVGGTTNEYKKSYLDDAPEDLPPDPLEEARRSAADLGAFFRSLGPAERFAAGATLGLLASLLLPWRWTKVDDDESLGLVAAFPATLLAVGLAVLIYIRARRANAALANTLANAQAGCALLITLFCAWFLRSSNEQRMIRGVGHGVIADLSHPLWPAWLGTGCAGLALLATLAIALGRRN